MDLQRIKNEKAYLSNGKIAKFKGIFINKNDKQTIILTDDTSFEYNFSPDFKCLNRDVKILRLEKDPISETELENALTFGTRLVLKNNSIALPLYCLNQTSNEEREHGKQFLALVSKNNKSKVETVSYNSVKCLYENEQEIYGIDSESYELKDELIYVPLSTEEAQRYIEYTDRPVFIYLDLLTYGLVFDVHSHTYMYYSKLESCKGKTIETYIKEFMESNYGGLDVQAIVRIFKNQNECMSYIENLNKAKTWRDNGKSKRNKRL